MKRLILIVFAALLAPTTAQAGWWRTYGGGGWEEGLCVQITSDSNYIISGTKGDSLWLLKVDTSGNILWAKAHGSGDPMRGRWVEETNDGGYIVTSQNPSLIKTDTQGDTLWTRDYGMYSYCVQEAADSGYIVIGSDDGETYLVVIKTNSDGDTLWAQAYMEPGHNKNAGFFIQETFDGGYVITGTTGIEEEEFATKYLWLVKINADGDTLWTQEYGMGGIGEFNKGCCVRQTSDGGYIITGYKDYEGLWLLKTDANGDTLWTKIYNTSSGGTGFSVQQTQDGGYILVGVTETFTTSLNAGTAKLWLLKTDEYGDTLWTRIYGGNDGDVGRCVQQTSDLGYIVVGYTRSFGAGERDVYLLKTDSLGLLGVTEKTLTQEPRNWHVVSSIGPQIVLYYFEHPQGFRVSIFDVCGQRVDEVCERGPTGSITWGTSHPPGVYFLQVVANKNKIQTARIVLIR